MDKKTIGIILAVIAALIAIWDVAIFTNYTISNANNFVEVLSELFLLPGLYFLQIIAIVLFGIAAVWNGAPKWTLWLWTMGGILTTFSILGAFSIGPLLMPVTVLTLINALLFTRGAEESAWWRLGRFAAGALGQAAVMFSLIMIH